MSHSRFAGELRAPKCQFHASSYFAQVKRAPKEHSVVTVKAALKGVACGDGLGSSMGGDLGETFATGVGPDGRSGSTPMPPSASIVHRGAWMWTAPYAFERIARSVNDDDECMLQRLMPLIQATNQYLREDGRPQSEVIAFRGSRANVSAFLPGVMYRFGMYVSSTGKVSKAVEFYELFEKESMIEFHIPQGCNNAGNLESITFFRGEEEYLLPPYTIVTCREVHAEGKEFTMSDGQVKVIPYVVFDVAYDSLRIEHEFERFANLYIATNFYQVLKASELRATPTRAEVQAAIDAYLGSECYQRAARCAAPSNPMEDLGHALRCSETGTGPGDAAAKLATAFLATGSGWLCGADTAQSALFRDDFEELSLLRSWLQALLKFFRATANPACTVHVAVAEAEYARCQAGEYVILCRGVKLCSYSSDVALLLAEAEGGSLSGTPSRVASIKVPSDSPWFADLSGAATVEGDEKLALRPYTIAQVLACDEANLELEVIPDTEPGPLVLQAHYDKGMILDEDMRLLGRLLR